MMRWYTKRCWACWAVTVLLLLALCPAQAQDGNPEFSAEVFVKRGTMTGLATADIYTKLPYVSLKFINTPDGFTAQYQVTAEIYQLDDDGQRQNLVQSPIWDRTIRVPNYADTQADLAFDKTTQAVLLPPGTYMFEFQVEDAHTSQAHLHEMQVDVPNFETGVTMSDALLLESFDEETNTIYPSISNRFGTESQRLWTYFEMYLDEPRTITVAREIIRTGRKGSVPDGADAPAEEAEVFYADEQQTRYNAGVNQHVTHIPLQDAKVGEHLLRVVLRDENGKVLAETQDLFMLEWSGLTDHLTDLDQAIAQLAYIAKRDEIRHIRRAENTEDRLERFMAFWDKRDPTPNTRRNEYMEEYYYRIAYANDRFGIGSIGGWKTDRGLVHVKWGEPDYVERHPFSFNTEPYEIWWYYRIGRRFIFIDKTGLGDFELLVPVWDERTRIR